MAKSEAGEPVDNLAEHNIDLLLLEEFIVSRDFLAWFCSRIGVRAGLRASQSGAAVPAASGLIS
ncbi:MAG: hypothetical protein OXF26_04250 [Alphaproteobacteria bacterium]|nr:hypothetical protein [Alphaproteobacteria bacterium]MCY4319961.1 hypothetical protein [Alphaproteobacteria bacterium]